MRRIYSRRFMKARVWALLVVLLAAAAVASRMMHIADPPEGVGLLLLRVINWAPAALLGLGLIWLSWRQWDAVAFFDADLKARRYRAWLWRPFGWRRVDGALDDVTGWHYRGGRPPAICARLVDPPVDLSFTLRPGTRLDAAWQRIAPGAFAAYERDWGSSGRGR